MLSLRHFAYTVFAAALAGCGHVDRQVTIQSNPEGALVYLNGQEVGRTPFTTDITWYGWYDVVVRREGHETLKVRQPVMAPWWQWVPLDFIADVTPGRKVDHHRLYYTLRPQPEGGVDADLLIDRAESMRPLLESGALTRRRPITPSETVEPQPTEEPSEGRANDNPPPIEMQEESSE